MGDVIGGVINLIRTIFCLAKGINCGSRLGVLIPKGCGKTYLSNALQSTNKKTILLDIESLVYMSLNDEQKSQLNQLQRSQEWQNLKLFLLPLWKDFLQDLMNKFKHTSVYIFTSSPEALSHLQCSKKECYIPSQSFFDELVAKVSDENKKKVMIQSRNEIISAYGGKAKIFSSFQDLQRQISEDFQLVPKI